MGHPVMRFQIVAKDPEGASVFYSQLFDWSINRDNALGYRTIDTGSEAGIQGGIWPIPPEAQSLVQLYIEVTDVAGTVDEARQLGAQVLVEPQALPDGDQMAILIDPEGVPFGVFRPKGES